MNAQMHKQLAPFNLAQLSDFLSRRLSLFGDGAKQGQESSLLARRERLNSVSATSRHGGNRIHPLSSLVVITLLTSGTVIGGPALVEAIQRRARRWVIWSVPCPPSPFIIEAVRKKSKQLIFTADHFVFVVIPWRMSPAAPMDNDAGRDQAEQGPWPSHKRREVPRPKRFLKAMESVDNASMTFRQVPLLSNRCQLHVVQLCMSA
ncbi:hypothetical protein B0O80DRAFT_265118, partial [Mortierella sp. GBAus27b]